MADSDDSSEYSSYLTPLKARGSTPTRTPKSPVEKLHQKEVNRISELWEGTQDELRRTGREIKLIEEKQKDYLDKVFVVLCSNPLEREGTPN
jgi:hypothetical protein